MAATLTPGAHIVGDPYNGIAPVTFNVDGTPDLTPNTLALRDSGGCAGFTNYFTVSQITTASGQTVNMDLSSGRVQVSV